MEGPTPQLFLTLDQFLSSALHLKIQQHLFRATRTKPTRLMSCSPASEAVMSLHKAWRAGGGRPEGWDQRELFIIHTQGTFFIWSDMKFYKHKGQNGLHVETT